MTKKTDLPEDISEEGLEQVQAGLIINLSLGVTAAPMYKHRAGTRSFVCAPED